ncbi:MAG: hypothetical protein LBK52_06270 [Deltaproteobacteria bacterium]|jgi:hypothetical protein|nr:hypothetical protein [Deltaproteobacteria bacterium]
MEYDDLDPMEEIRRTREQLLEMYGGMEGLRKHMDEQRPIWEKQGLRFLTQEEIDVLRKRRVTD